MGKVTQQVQQVRMTPAEFRRRLRESKDESSDDERQMPRSTIDPNDPAVRAFEQSLADDQQMEREFDDVPPVGGPTDFGDVALSLFDTTKDMISKTRLPRNKRMLYTRAIVVARHFGLLSILQYVFMDLKLMIPEDGKRVREFLTPFENLLRDRSKINQSQGPQI